MIFFYIVFCCQMANATTCEEEVPLGFYKPKYAKYFLIKKYKDFKIIEINTSELNDKFIIQSKPLSCHSNLPIFSHDAKRFIATSTSYVSLLSVFKLESRLVGFQGVNYLNYFSQIKNIKNIHFLLNPEELILLKPDLIMAYASNIGNTSRLKELRALRLPIFLNFDYKESHPLARAEWMVLSGLFFNREIESESLFKEIEKNYLRLKTEATNYTNKKILVGSLIEGRWVMTGGRSDLAVLLNDANANMLLSRPSQETQYLSMEDLFSLKEKADLWITHNEWHDKNLLLKDSRYQKFRELKVYNNNKKINKFGFNDYWQTGIMRPDLLLKDLITIIHKKKVETHKLNWYRELQ